MDLFGCRLNADLIQDVDTVAVTEVTATRLMVATDITDGRTGMAAGTCTGARSTDADGTVQRGTANGFRDVMSRATPR